MKHFLIIVNLLFITGIPLIAQKENNEGHPGIRDKMNEYIQRRLDLTKEESAKFSPVFFEYFKEWRTTLRENKGDKLELQKKIVDLRLRYRVRFREILGEQRGNQVFGHQEAFVKELYKLRQERLGKTGGRPLLRRSR